MTPDLTLRRIALFGNFGTGNLGNEATLQAMLHNLRRRLPNAEITCVCPAPEIAGPQYNISAVPIRARFPIWNLSSVPRRDEEPPAILTGSVSGATEPSRLLSRAFARVRPALRTCAYPWIEVYRWFKAIATLKGVDFLIMPGTGMVGSYGIKPLGLHYDIFRWAVIAKLCGCKLLFVGVGGGPTPHLLSRWFVRWALALADYRSYRDASTKDRLGTIGVDVKDDAVCPDLAFSLPKAVLPATHSNSRGVVVGVGLMNYYNRSGCYGEDDTTYRNYLARVASFVARLLEDGYTVRVLVGDITWDQGARQDLRKILEEQGLKYENKRIIDEPAASVDELLFQLSSVDIVAASRFHNLLLALMLEKPVFALSYHEKFKPLMDGVGLGDFCQDIEHIDVHELMEKIAILREEAIAIKVQIARQTEAYRRELDAQYDRILNLSPRRRSIIGTWARAYPSRQSRYVLRRPSNPSV